LKLLITKYPVLYFSYYNLFLIIVSKAEFSLNSINSFINESTIINKFLENEKQSSRELLEVRRTISNNEFEILCQQKFGQKISYVIPNDFQIDPIVFRIFFNTIIRSNSNFFIKKI
jgi:hypothetical protein